MSVAITDRTHTLRILTVGYANVESKTPVTTLTRFPIGSLTKGMTATALLELRDAKRLDVQRPVRAYLPWFSIHSGGTPVLVHQLLSHTAGFPDDYTFSPGFSYGVAALRGAHTIFAPGTQWAYSNDGYATAGAILAAIDGRPWADALQARVFDPLGMTNSSPVFTPETLEDAATGYAFEDMNRILPAAPRLVPTDPDDFVNPAGSVISNAPDMAKYVRYLLNGGVADNGRRILSPASYALLTTPDTVNGKPAGPTMPVLAEAPDLFRHYAFGLAVHRDNGDTILGHTGGIAGYTACMEADVTRGFGVVALSNLVEAPLHPCAIVLYAMRVLRAQSQGSPLPPLPSPQPTYLQQTAVRGAGRFAGTYTDAQGNRLVFTSDGHGLSLETGNTRKPLYPRGGTTFYVDDPRFAIYGLTFVAQRNGVFDQVLSGAQWYTTPAYRGAKTFDPPHAWERFTGRYEAAEEWGFAPSNRVLIVKGQLTLDGALPLVARKNGTFSAGSSTVRFDTPAAGKFQRMWIDGTPLYRIDLP